MFLYDANYNHRPEDAEMSTARAAMMRQFDVVFAEGAEVDPRCSVTYPTGSTNLHNLVSGSNPCVHLDGMCVLMTLIILQYASQQCL